MEGIERHNWLWNLLLSHPQPWTCTQQSGLTPSNQFIQIPELEPSIFQASARWPSTCQSRSDAGTDARFINSSGRHDASMAMSDTEHDGASRSTAPDLNNRTNLTSQSYITRALSETIIASESYNVRGTTRSVLIRNPGAPG